MRPHPEPRDAIRPNAEYHVIIRNLKLREVFDYEA